MNVERSGDAPPAAPVVRVTSERCTECGAALTEGVCGTCGPTGRPVDKGERRLLADAASHEKELWDLRRVNRKVRVRSSRAGVPSRR